jgi:hypothetical protein
VAIFDQAATYTVTFNFATTLSVLEILNTAGTVTFDGTTTTGLNLGGLTLTATAVWSCLTANIQFGKTGTYVIDTKGVLLRDVTFSVSTATRTLGSDLYAKNANVNEGVLNLNGYTLTADKLDCSGTGTRTLAFGTGQITLVGGDTYLLELIYASIVMTGSKRINISSARTGTAFVAPRNYGINLYVTQGSFAIELSGVNRVVNTLDCTGYTGQIRGNLSVTGNLTLAAGTTWDTSTVTFSGSGTKLITTNGAVLPTVTVNASGGTVRLLDSLTATGTTSFLVGTLDLNGFTLTSDQFNAVVSNGARTLAFGAGQITVTGLVTSSIIDLYNSSFPSLITMTGSKRINISSARTVVALADLGPYEVDLYVTQGAYSLGISGNSVLRNADFTGFTGAVGGSPSLTGNLVLGAGMSGVGEELALTISGTGVQTITSNGRVVIGYLGIIGTGTVQLQDAFTFKPDGFLEMYNGVLDLNGFVMETNTAGLIGYDYAGDPTTPELKMSSGVLRSAYGLSLDAGLWDEGYLLPTITGPGTIEVFVDDLNNANIGWEATDSMDPRVANFPTVRHTGTASLRVNGNNTFQSFESLSAAGGVAFFFGQTNTFGTFNVSGAPGNLKSITADPGYVVATQATLLKSTTWFVGANSVDDGNNTGLIFTAGGINDYLAISNIIGSGSGTTYATDVVEGVDLSDAAVAAEIKPASVQEAVEAQDATAVVVSDLVWSEFDDSQTPNWQNVDNTQVPTWTPVDDSQTPGWTPVTP